MAQMVHRRNCPRRTSIHNHVCCLRTLRFSRDFYVNMVSLKFRIPNLKLTRTFNRIMYCFGIPRSGARIHATLLQTVFRAPQSFFDSTDSGSLLNRFSQDISIIDSHLPVAVLITFQALVNVLILTSFIASGSSWMGLTLPILFLTLYGLQKLYLRTSRQLRFLDLETKSPLYSHFLETIDGISHIRSFAWQNHFRSLAYDKLDASQRPYYLMYCIQRWLNLALGFVVGAMAVVVISLAIAVRSSSSSGQLGVALTSVLQLDSNFQYLMLFWTNLETSLGAIARIRDFEKDTPSEISLESNEIQVPDNWPSKGEIVFENVEARYVPSQTPSTQSSVDEEARPTKPALSLSLALPSHSRIGVIGRTGSGKSTLLSLLTGLIRPSSGQILIDGLSLSQVPLSTLRQRLITIPQDPFILPGVSIRENLDPTQKATENDIVEALAKVGLWEKFASRFNSGATSSSDTDTNEGENEAQSHKILETPMSTTTSTLSAGENQMFGLARAVLKKTTTPLYQNSGSGVLLLDEATSNTDHATDQVLQHVIRDVFHGWTVVTVAHRLETVADAEVIVKLEAGEVASVDKGGK
jgi:ATP-binding cassette, subfamily C (CFTR/MRP), member 1